MKNIILINPPWYFAHPRDAIIPHNLGLGFLGAYLRQHGVSAGIINSIADDPRRAVKIRGRYQSYWRVGSGYEDIVRRVPEDTELIGISAPFTNNAAIVKELARVLKARRPRIPIVLGGVYPSLLPSEAQDDAIDYYVIGEGERALLALASGKDPAGIKGVRARGRDTGPVEAADVIEDLDSLPFPLRDASFLRAYPAFSPRGERLRTASIITSRGCPFDCSFCSIHLITGYAWRRRSAGNVLLEISELIRASGIEHIEFEDDNLTLDKGRAVEIFEGIQRLNKEGTLVSWSTPNGVRVDSLDRQMLGVMKRSGCRSLSFGVESGDPEIIRRMNKKLEFDKVTEMVSLCREIGIRTNIFLMIGYPGETHESFKLTMRAVEALKARGADVIWATVTRAYPGTKLFDECRQQGILPADENREDVFLGNISTPGNTLITADFTRQDLRRRLSMLERATVPWYLRAYRRCAPVIKMILPEAIVQWIRRKRSVR